MLRALHASKLAHALVLGLIGAAILHIVMLIMLPGMAPRDAWARLALQSGLYEVAPYAPESDIAAQAGVADPFFQAVACRFDLADGFAHLTHQGRIPYWSASVYDRKGQNIFSLNDRSSKDGELDIVVLTPAQAVDLRKAPLEGMESSVLVEAPISEGTIVVRGFAPDPSWAGAVLDFLSAIQCAPETI